MLASPRPKQAESFTGAIKQFQSYSGCLLPHDTPASGTNAVYGLFQSYSGCLLPHDGDKIGTYTVYFKVSILLRMLASPRLKIMAQEPIGHVCFNPTQDACF